MSSSNLKYDVAFSFCAQDEELASHLYNEISNKYSAFIYSKKQEELVGTDGEKTFNRVFSEEARTVIVLYQNKWGETSWTRIEETAIRNRAFEKGYEFVLFIPVSKNFTMPSWLPRTSIYFDYFRFGIEGLLSVLDSHIQRNGGAPKVESNLDKALKFQENLNYQSKLKKYLNSEVAVSEAFKFFRDLKIEIEYQLSEIDEGLDDFFFRVEGLEQKRHNNFFSITSYSSRLRFNWESYYGNVLSESSLQVDLVIIEKDMKSYDGNSLKVVKKEVYEYIFDRFDNFVWKDRSTEKLYTNKELSEMWIRELLDLAFKNKGQML